MKFLAWYSFFIMAFSLSFYILLHKDDGSEVKLLMISLYILFKLFYNGAYVLCNLMSRQSQSSSKLKKKSRCQNVVMDPLGIMTITSFFYLSHFLFKRNISYLPFLCNFVRPKTSDKDYF